MYAPPGRRAGEGLAEPTRAARTLATPPHPEARAAVGRRAAGRGPDVGRAGRARIAGRRRVRSRTRTPAAVPSRRPRPRRRAPAYPRHAAVPGAQDWERPPTPRP